MAQLITAPDTEAFERLFKDGLTCKMAYGNEVCGKPAQWKVIMACCGASDFFCAECFTDAATPQLPRGTLIKTPWKTVTDQAPGYFGCSHCLKVHDTFAQAVKEKIKL